MQKRWHPQHLRLDSYLLPTAQAPVLLRRQRHSLVPNGLSSKLSRVSLRSNVPLVPILYFLPLQRMRSECATLPLDTHLGGRIRFISTMHVYVCLCCL